ncbi:antitoxin HicB [Spirochaetia bacterium]|nr:antitoxin HicB [Spirochaetia bacterium]
MNEYTVLLTWDDEARVWVAENDEIPLALESGSLDVLMEQVRLTAPEILELNGKEHVNVYLNFTTKRRAKVYA